MKVTFTEFSNGCYVKDINYQIFGDVDVPLNTDLDSRVNFVTSIAAISRGKDKSNSKYKRYDKLLKEAAPDLSFKELDVSNSEIGKVPGRPLEFAPVILDYHTTTVNDVYEVKVLHQISLKSHVATLENEEFMNYIAPFSFIENGKLYTNIRALMAAGIKHDDIPFSHVTNYKAIEVKAPYFVFGQIRTHGRLSQIALSARVVEEDEYWLPEDVLSKVKKTLTYKHIEDMDLDCIGCDECKYSKRILDASSIDELVDIFLELPIGKVQNILKIAGYHKEIYDRWPNHLMYKRWIIGGYMNDPKAWSHFLLEREAYPELYSSWVQDTTRETAVAIKKVLLDK